MMEWLSSLDRGTIQLAAQVTSTLVALLALFIGLRNEARNQRRFELQLSLSREVARAAAKPLLAIEREGYEDVKAITIANHGPGTAICHVIKFVLGKKKASDISELIKINEDDDIVWNESTAYATPYYLAGKSSEDAFRITAERLRECKIAPSRIPELLGDIERQLDKIEIFVEYEDVFGSKFKLEDVARPPACGDER
jgi:hypothetical protein